MKAKQIKNGKWQVRWRDEEGLQRARNFLKQVDAAEWMTRERIRIRNSYEFPRNAPYALKRFGNILKAFPIERSPRIYFLIHKEEIVYVGQSRNLAVRLASHFIDKTFDGVFYMEVSARQLLPLEAELIREFKPKYNRYFPRLAAGCLGTLPNALEASPS